MGSATISGSIVTTTGMQAPQHMQFSEDFVYQAGVVNLSNDFVVQQYGPSKTVTVSSGIAYVLQQAYTRPNNTLQKYWRVVNEDATSSTSSQVTIADNVSGNPRIDSICIKVDTSAMPNANASNVATIVAVQGTPNPSPVAPSIPANFLLLANIAVANGFSSITTANITDARVISGLVNSVFSYFNVNNTTGGQSIVNGTDTRINFGFIVLDKNNEWNTSTSRFTAKQSGVYYFDLKARFQDANSTSYVTPSIRVNGGRIAVEDYTNAGPFQSTKASLIYYLNTGDYVEAYLNHTQGSVGSTFRTLDAALQNTFIGMRIG